MKKSILLSPSSRTHHAYDFRGRLNTVKLKRVRYCDVTEIRPPSGHAKLHTYSPLKQKIVRLHNFLSENNKF